MRLARRNTTLFDYYAFNGQTTGRDENGFYTGEPALSYATPVTLRGTISAPSGSVVQALDGLEEAYTNTLVMDTPNTGIKEDGLICWNGEYYAVVAVRPSINFTLIALRKKIVNHGDIVIINPGAII